MRHFYAVYPANTEPLHNAVTEARAFQYQAENDFPRVAERRSAGFMGAMVLPVYLVPVLTAVLVPGLAVESHPGWLAGAPVPSDTA